MEKVERKGGREGRRKEEKRKGDRRWVIMLKKFTYPALSKGRSKNAGNFSIPCCGRRAVSQSSGRTPRDL